MARAQLFLLASLFMSAALTKATAKKWVHMVGTGKADCSGGKVHSESYNALDTCMPLYGKYSKKFTCNSTHIITSMYLKTANPPCSGTPAKSVAAPLCNPKTGALTTCSTSAPVASYMAGEKAKCANPYQENFIILDRCVKNGAKVSTKNTCTNGVLHQKKYSTPDCTGAYATDTKKEPMYGRMGTTGLTTDCLGPVPYEQGTPSAYSEYYTLKGATEGCPEEDEDEDEDEDEEDAERKYDATASEKKSEATGTWALPLLGVVSMFSLAAFVAVRAKRTRQTRQVHLGLPQTACE